MNEVERKRIEDAISKIEYYLKYSSGKDASSYMLDNAVKILKITLHPKHTLKKI